MDDQILVPVSPAPVSAKALRRVSQLFSETWALYKEKFSLLTKVMTIPTVIFFVASVVGYFFQTVAGFSVVFILEIIGVVVAIIAQAGVTRFVADKGSVSIVGEVLRFGKGKFFPLVWVFIVSVFIIGGVMLLCLSITFAVALLVSFLFHSTILSAVIAMLSIIPIVAVSTWFAFVVPALVIDDNRGLSALLKSRELTQGNFWGVFGRLILFVLVGMIIGIVLSLLSSIFGSAGKIIGNLLTLVFSFLFFSPFGVIYQVSMYTDLKTAKGDNLDSAQTRTAWIISAVIGWILAVIAFIAMVVLVGVGISYLLGGMSKDLLAGSSTTTDYSSSISSSTDSNLPVAMPAGLTPEVQKQIQDALKQAQALQDAQKQLPPAIN